MEILWQKGPVTVHQLMESLPAKPALAYNSVLTTIRILEKKGYVGHLKDGRAHVYQPLIGRQEASRSEIRHLVNRFFRNSHEALLRGVGNGHSPAARRQAAKHPAARACRRGVGKALSANARPGSRPSGTAVTASFALPVGTIQRRC